MARKANITKLATSLTVPDWANHAPGTGSAHDVAARILRDVISIDDAAAAAIEAVADNPDLSAVGIAKEQVATGTAKIAALAPLRAEVGKVIGKAVAKARAKETEQTPEAAMASMLRATESRRWIFETVGKDSMKLDGIIREAEERGDTETIDAILSAPPAWPLSGSFDRAAVTAKRDGMIDENLGPEIVVLAQAEKDLADRLDWTEQRIKRAAGISSEGNGISTIADADVAISGA